MRPDLSLPTIAAAIAVLGATACTRTAPSAESKAITREEPPTASATAPAPPPPPPAQPTSAATAGPTAAPTTATPLTDPKPEPKPAPRTAVSVRPADKGSTNTPPPPKTPQPGGTASGTRLQGSASCGAGTCAATK